MKHLKYHIISVFILVFALAGCNEKLEIDKKIIDSVGAPVISDFSPSSGTPGTEVTIKGTGFSTVDSVLINGVKTAIKYRISDNELIIAITGMESSGIIKAFNAEGSGESAGRFTVIYKDPENLEYSVSIDETISSGSTMDITGENLNVVNAIYLSGNTDRKAKILFQSENKITFEVPVTCDTQAKVKLEYHKGATAYYTESAEYTTDKIIVPPVLEYCPAQSYNGQAIIINITNPDRIDGVYLETQDEVIPFLFKTLEGNDKIQVITPANFTHETTGRLWIEHNACENLDLESDFKVVVPNCHYNFNFYVMAQGDKNKNSEHSFYDAEAGITYSDCEVANHPSDIEFISYSNSNGGFVFYGPHALGANTIKNFYCGSTGLDMLVDLSVFNADTVKFRRLDPNNTKQAVLIKKFKNCEIVNITDDLFEGITLPAANNMAYYKVAAGTSAYSPGDVIWFRNSRTKKNGLLSPVSVDYSGAGQDKFSSAEIDVLYQK